MTVFYEVFQETLKIAIPLMIVALGGLISEKSGVTNIALEGIMIFGGFFGIWMIQYLERSYDLPLQMLFVLGVTIAAIAGALFSMLHGFASVYMKSDQIISATALNIFAVAFVVFVARSTQTNREGILTNGSQIEYVSRFLINEFPVLSQIPIIGDMFFKQMYISIFFGIALLIITSLVLQKTRVGLRLRACGENPHSADSLGINIYRMRFFAVFTSGAFAGIGGIIYQINTSGEYAPTVAGVGFLAIAVLIFGNWKPKYIALASLFFGMMRVLGEYHANISFLSALSIPSQIYGITPFITTLLVLAFFSKTSRAPKALGQIYDQGKR